MSNPHTIKQKVLKWASTFDVCCCLDSNQYSDPYSEFDCLIAIGVDKEVNTKSGNAFNSLKNFYKQHQGWMFGFFSYDLKNEIENLQTIHIDKLHFPDLYFFTPKYLLSIKNNNIEVLLGDKNVVNSINLLEFDLNYKSPKINIENSFDKQEYIETVNKLKNHIKRGDIYEVNFCQEFFAKNAEIEPLSVYNELNKISPTPFSGFFKINQNYILSATPERFLCKRDNKLISQPIKGTTKRSLDHLEDEKIKSGLRNSEKEQAENVMIVDLVRNDLTKSAVKGSVNVEELFGIYSFSQVHQMISTISCEIDPDIHFIDAIKNTFPMGSMTGAPKIKAMQLIDEYEKTKRGIYSGAFGYISPNGNFDFNVIIRSILYNATTKYLSYQVGGAITYASDPEKEYEECLLKASAILKVLKG